MKRLITIFLCLAMLLCACLTTAVAAEPTDPTGDATEVNTGPAAGNAFFIFALIIIVAGGIYLYFMLKK